MMQEGIAYLVMAKKYLYILTKVLDKKAKNDKKIKKQGLRRY